MTIEELIYQESLKMDSGHIVKGCRDCAKGLSQAILSWFKEEVSKNLDCRHTEEYNNAIRDILNLTAKQGE